MLLFGTGCVLFGVAFTIHFLLWRIRLPKAQFKGLLVIFALVFCAWAAMAAVTRHYALLDFIHIASFYASCGVCYVVLYSAFNLDSPTLSLVRFIAEKGSDGRGIDEAGTFLAKRPFVQGRLGQLMEAGLISEQDGRYRVKGRGSPGFRFILGYRKLYGAIPKGG